MNFTDKLQDGLNQLRDALEALAFALNSVVIQKGCVVLPDDEVTGEYLAALPVGLTLHERERAAVHLDEQFTVHRETNAVVLIPLSNDHSGKLATDGMRAGMSSYLITGNPRDLLDGLQAADSEN